MKIAFRPKLLDCLPGYNRAQFGKDLASGITVGVLGGLDSLGGAVLAGLLLGIIENVASGYLDPLLGGGTRPRMG